MPTGDLVLRRMAAPAQRLLSVRELEERARAWQPWRGYAVMHLWRAASAEAVRAPTGQYEAAGHRAPVRTARYA
jgi:AraC family transcriptional regulator of adaptative response / DNA-3-methyladenine glycosylase II